VTPLPLPETIRARFIDGINGLRVHVLEAGFETPGRPALLLLHGFPELAFSWRKVMLPLAAAGYHVIAPDQRGYGRTTGWSDDYDGDLTPFRVFSLVRDAVGLLAALGVAKVEAVVGHDFGSPVAAWCTMLRPDIFTRVALMSSPFPGAPPLPVAGAAPVTDIHAALAALPRPRKHYQWYYSERHANADMMHAPGGLPKFLRAYYHHKSADWPGNAPHPLDGWNAEALAKMPTYYVMDAAHGMPEAVAEAMPAGEAAWLTDAELAVYAGEYARTGFQGGLQWYRTRTSGRFQAEQEIFAGKTIDVPAIFFSGASDWGVQQVPGALDRMRAACPRMGDIALIPGAGHWVQQEQPEATVAMLLNFLAAG
jgi:pimeloyl-ACP methyl ester carboxylesterase